MSEPIEAAVAGEALPVEGPSPAVPDAASVTLEDVQQDPELSLYITSADRVMDAMGLSALFGKVFLRNPSGFDPRIHDQVLSVLSLNSELFEDPVRDGE